MKEKILSVLLIIISFGGCFLIYEHFNKPRVINSYEDALFDNSFVHKIEVEIENEDLEDLRNNPLLKTKYKVNVTIDGELIEEVSFATKGNHTLNAVQRKKSDRYSYKINFGKYNKEQTYYGLDKLNLNNIMSDPTYMKDYMSYFIMRNNLVYAPLVSYVELYINGEYMGLYNAVEEVEDAFIERNGLYADSILYKPESSYVYEYLEEKSKESHIDRVIKRATLKESSHVFSFDGADLLYKGEEANNYIDIFDNAQSSITDQNQREVINAINALNNYDYDLIEKYFDVDSIINYFAVNNYVFNFDSYTGPYAHNYYLLYNDGKFSIVPWDYNLAFGKFAGPTNGEIITTQIVNYAIDTPCYGVEAETRPLWNMIYKNSDYMSVYHDSLKDVISDNSLYIDEINKIYRLIKRYVKKDASSFYTFGEFKAAVSAFKKIINYRSESVKGQLNGSIPSTSKEQESESGKLYRIKDVGLAEIG